MNPSKITTTVGLNIGQIDIQGVRLSFWDLGGQQELQSLWDKVLFYTLHLVFSICNQYSLPFSTTQNHMPSST